MGITVADFRGTEAPGKVGQDFYDAAGDDLLVCFEALVTREPAALGKVLVRALVIGDGHTKGAALAEDTVGDGAFAACVVKAVEKMTLPRADKGAAVLEVDVMKAGGGIVGVVGAP